MKAGERYESFGQVYQVVKIARNQRDIRICRVIIDRFAEKEMLVEERCVHVSFLGHMRLSATN